jgi:tetratricopeptide (TPR) repeat protein
MGETPPGDDTALTDKIYASVIARCGTAQHGEAIADAVQWPSSAIVPAARRFAPSEAKQLARAVLVHLEAARLTSGDQARAQRSAAYTAASRLQAVDAALIALPMRRDAVLAVIESLHGALDVIGVHMLVTKGLADAPDDPELLLARGALQETAVAMPPSGRTISVQIREADQQAAAVRALTDYSTALAGDPSLVEARLRRGRVLARLGRYEEARGELTRARHEVAAVELRYLADLFLGQVHEDTGHLRDAEAAYEEAGQLFGQAQAPYIALAHLRHRQGRFVAATDVIASMGSRAASALTDPLWIYDYGQFWRLGQRIAALHAALSR